MWSPCCPRLPSPPPVPSPCPPCHLPCPCPFSYGLLYLLLVAFSTTFATFLEAVRWGLFLILLLVVVVAFIVTFGVVSPAPKYEWLGLVDTITAALAPVAAAGPLVEAQGSCLWQVVMGLDGENARQRDEMEAV